ncbi:MAG: DNA repair protein RadA [Firmicutes bacterium]|nr:DNA repair protein RadA [Bacillota bacterium]
MKSKTIYVCSKCDYQYPKLLGRCPQCGAYGSFVEETFEPESEISADSPKKSRRRAALSDARAVKINDTEAEECARVGTGYPELDRVLGGGLVSGSVVLLSGEPGIGKSTILLQICDVLAKSLRVLYVSGEESAGQLRLRASRLSVNADELYIYTGTDVDKIISECDKIKPDVLVADSVQTLYSELSSSTQGSVSQVRECAQQLSSLAKARGISVILVGHVNKEGGIAGPKVLEHMVDAVLYFEGERHQNFRIIRAVKNRYGATNEIGVFEMTDSGLIEVENPSAMLISGRPRGVSGSSTVCCMEGTRPIIAEIQALTVKTVFPSPKRTADGFDYGRLYLLIAVLEKRLSMKFYDLDVYLNVIGGLRLDEPACDLAVALALISAAKDVPVSPDLVVAGEIGLAGEVRGVSNIDIRVREAARLGFSRMAIPRRGATPKEIPDGIEIIPVRSVYELISLLEKTSQDKSQS